MKYTIYLRTNLINGKQYVGQTSNLEKREKAWKKINGIYGNKFLSEERKKYGLDNFNIDILELCESENADEKERFYIEKFNTLFPNGYNVQSGGKKGFTYEETIETKNKKSLSHKGKTPPCVVEKRVYQYTMDKKLIAVYKSVRDAERKTGLAHTNISVCCRGGFFSKKRNKWVNRIQYKGYIWSFNEM